MPRPVAMHVSYRSDAAFLLRLQTAVTKDTRRTPTWQREVCGHLNAVVQLLLQAEDDDLGGTVSRAKSKSREAPSTRE